MYRPTRRGFMMGCSAAIANVAAARFTNLVFADPMIVGNHDTLIVLFLRGGMDGLSFVMPTGGPDRAHYETARPVLKIPASRRQRRARPRHDGRQPVRAAPGSDRPAQSLPGRQGRLRARRRPRHLQPQPLRQPGADGARHAGRRRHHRRLAHPPLPDLPGPAGGHARWCSGSRSRRPSRAPGSPTPTSSPSPTATTFSSTPARRPGATPRSSSLRNILDLHSDVDPRYAQGLVSLDASGFIEQNVPTLSSYVPANGAVYPAGSFGDSLKLTAQLIKLDMGLRAATLDLGGWDTHNGQGTAADGQFFWEKIQELSQALAAFYTDLDGAGANAYAGSHDGRRDVGVRPPIPREQRLRHRPRPRRRDHRHGRTGRRRSLRQLAGARQRPALRRRRPRHHHRLPPRALRDRRQPARAIRTGSRSSPATSATRRSVSSGPILFNDGFESGNTASWNATVP